MINIGTTKKTITSSHGGRVSIRAKGCTPRSRRCVENSESATEMGYMDRLTSNVHVNHQFKEPLLREHVSPGSELMLSYGVPPRLLKYLCDSKENSPWFYIHHQINCAVN